MPHVKTMNNNILFEKYTVVRSNYWNGLRNPINQPVGRNWMLYYCLRAVTKNTGPLDCIMYLINEFLNWIPASCWYNSTIHNCPVCKCSKWGGDVINIPISYCSYECSEKESRKNIMEEWQQTSDVISLLMYYPIQDVIQELETILEDVIEYQGIDGIPLEWLYDNYDEHDLYDNYDFYDIYD